MVANNGRVAEPLILALFQSLLKVMPCKSTAGQDAKVTIDGVAVTRTSNSIDDVISGATLDISRVEAGSTVNITITRDTDKYKRQGK